MTILAIETSCDDTAIAILKIQNSRFANTRIKFEVLSNVVSSQTKIHAKYGGVFPTLAKREHERNLPIVLKKALREASFKNSKYETLNQKQIINSKSQNTKIDAVAVTV